MPRTSKASPLFAALTSAQDGILSRDQSIQAGISREAIRYRLRSRNWTLLLPDVYLTNRGDPSRRQKLIAALLYAGEDAAIDGADACRFHGIKFVVVDDQLIFVVVPFGSSARSRGFVVVRRTLAPITTVSTEMLRYVDPATAVIAATRRMGRERSVLAALSDALQRGITNYDELVRAHVQGPPRGSRFADNALEHLGAGTRSAPEADFRRLAVASSVLPLVEYNVWLRLPAGLVVCVDALIESSAVVHETNGRSAHAREDLFEDLQQRHDALTVAGLTVLHNSPRRIRLRGREVIAQVERCHELYAGRGLPIGIERLAIAA